MGQAERVEVVEYTDVMCSWAWGSEPKLRLLRWRYEDHILCGPHAEPPSGAKTYDWGHGIVYLRPDLYPAV